MLNEAKKISKFVTIGPAPDEAELQRLADAGYALIVNLSQRGELDQLISPEREGELVEKLNMLYLHIPTSVGKMKYGEVDSFVTAVSNSPGPAYVHCRLGQRAVPFAMIFHGLRRKLSVAKIFEKLAKLDIECRAPVIKDFIEKYFELREPKAA